MRTGNLKKKGTHQGWIAVNLLFLIFSLVVATTTSAEGPYDIYWKAQLGTAGTDTAYGVAGDGTGNLYVVGKTTAGLDGKTYAGGASDAFLVVYDINGAKSCSALLGTSGDDAAYGVAVYVDGSSVAHVYVVGETNADIDGAGAGTIKGGKDLFLAEFNSSCARQSVIQDGTASDEIAWAVAVNGTGDIFVTGETTGNFGGTKTGTKDAFLAKYNSSLVQQATAHIGAAGAASIAYAILVDANGDPNIVGETSGDMDGAGPGPFGLKDMFWAKYASSTLSIMKQLGTASDDVANGIARDDLGNIYFAGYSAGNLGGTGNAGGKDIVVVKYNSTATLQWIKQFGTASDDTAEGLTSDTTMGEVYIVGATAGSFTGYTLSGTSDAFVAKYDNAGTQMWVKQLGTSMADSSWSVVYDTGLLYLAGETTGVFTGSNYGGIDLIAAYLSTDQSAPNTTIGTKPASAINTTNATFTFSCSDWDPIALTYSLACPNATFMCKRSPATTYTSCTTPKTYTGLTDGSYTFSVYAVDASGYADGTPASYSWTVDTVPPTSTINTVTSPTNDNTPTFIFSSNQTGSTFECSLDTGSATWTACTSPKTYSTPIADNTYTFRVRATDPAGNLETPGQTATLVVDTSVPNAPTLIETTFGGCPTSPTNVGAYTFAFSSTSPDVASYWYAKNGATAYTQAASGSYSYSETADGAKSFSVKAKDTTGNFSAVTTCSWTYDKTAPTTTITSYPPSLSNDNTPTYAFTANQTGSIFECSLDTGAPSWVACTSPYTFVATPDGSYTFRVRASDVAGNVEATPKTKTLTIDTTAPVLTTEPVCPSPDTNVPAVSFSFASTDTDLPASPYYCSKDGGTFAVCSSPQNYTAVAGARSFSVKVKDLAGNYSAASTCSWTLDTTKPVTTITKKPATPNKNSSQLFNYGANEVSTYECGLTLTSETDPLLWNWEACGATYSKTGTHTFASVPDGVYTFRVRGTDRAGNIESSFISNNTAALTIDTIAPSVPTISSGPASLTTSSSATFKFTAEAGATFTCQLDTFAITSCLSGKTYIGLIAGDHLFKVWAKDAAGNKSAFTSYSWIVDLTAPDVALDTANAPLYSNVGTGQFIFSSTDSTASFQCKLTPATVFSPCTSPYNYGTVTELATGIYTFSVKSKDTAGNYSTAATYSFTVDKSAPNTSFSIKPDAVSTDPTPMFVITATEINSTFECSLDGAAFAPCASTYQVSPALPDGSHNFKARAIDRAGNTDATVATWTWTIDTSLPNATITAKPTSITNKTAASFSFTANKAGSTFECSLDGVAYAACTSPKVYAGPLLEGNHTFGVRAKNATGTGSSAIWSWDIDVTDPDVTIVSTPPDPSNDSTPTFSFSSTDTSATFLCSFDTGLYVACVSPYTRASALPTGLHTFHVKAKDLAGNIGTVASYSWTLDIAVPDAVLNSKPVNPSNDNTPTFSFSSLDTSATFECDLDGGTTPSWVACSSPHTYTTSLADGPHTFKVRAKDAAGNVDTTPAIYTWTIDTVVPNTTITTKPAATTGPNVTFAFTSSQTPATFQCMMSPAVTYSACSSPIAYTGLTTGSHTFRVRAKDAAGNVDSTPAIYTWTVQ